MTCNGEAPRTLQAAFEINISSLRPFERRTVPAASPQGGGRRQWRTLKQRTSWRVPLQWFPVNDNQSPARMRIFFLHWNDSIIYTSLKPGWSNLILHMQKWMQVCESMQEYLEAIGNVWQINLLCIIKNKISEELQDWNGTTGE